MRFRLTLLLGGLIVLVAGQFAVAQSGGLRVAQDCRSGLGILDSKHRQRQSGPVHRGPGTGIATRCAIGRNDARLLAGDLHNAGHYVVALVGARQRKLARSMLRLRINRRP